MLDLVHQKKIFSPRKTLGVPLRWWTGFVLAINKRSYPSNSTSLLPVSFLDNISKFPVTNSKDVQSLSEEQRFLYRYPYCPFQDDSVLFIKITPFVKKIFSPLFIHVSKTDHNRYYLF